MSTTPGPNAKLQRPEDRPALVPIPPDAVGSVDLDSLSADEIRARLDARQRDLQYHLQALKHEAVTIADDVNIGGRPLMDRIRERPIQVVAVAAGVGALLGGLLGLRARAKRLAARPEDNIDFVRARLAYALDDAAERVAAGDDVEHAIRTTMGAMPVIYGDSKGAGAQAASSTREAVDVAVKTAVGFAVKAAADMLVRRYTSHEGSLAAIHDEVT